MADYNSDRTGANIDATLDKVDALVDSGNNVTADSLTVDGSTLTYGQGGASLGWGDTSTLGQLSFDGSANPVVRSATGKALVLQSNGANNRLNIASNGDVSFYEDTGTTAKMVWDASAESLGIGTSSPQENLHIYSTSTNRMEIETNAPTTSAIVKLTTGSEGHGLVSNNGTLQFFDYGDSTERMSIDSSGNVGIGRTPTSHKFEVAGDIKLTGLSDSGFDFYTGSSRSSIVKGDSYLSFCNSADFNQVERARIDSSGNLLVGTTTANLASFGSNIGHQLNPDGYMVSARESNPALILNRRTTDGDIALFRKDGSTVGSIVSKDGDMVIGSGDTGIRFLPSTNTIYAASPATGGALDATVDLGVSNRRFKDLYLSGGVKTGGNSGSPTLVEDNGGIMLKYVVLDSLAGAQKTRFTFNISNRRSVLVKIKVAGSYTASNAEVNHMAGEYTVRLYATGSGATSDSSSAQLDFGYGYDLGDYTFTANTNNTCTIDIASPNSNPDYNPSYVVELLSATSYAGTLASVTTI